VGHSGDITAAAHRYTASGVLRNTPRCNLDNARFKLPGDPSTPGHSRPAPKPTELQPVLCIRGKGCWGKRLEEKRLQTKPWHRWSTAVDYL